MQHKLLFLMNSGLKVLEKYAWLLDSYVLDYFTDCHWTKLPTSWRLTLDNIEPQELGIFLTQNKISESQRVWPLSLLALHTTVVCLSLPRDQIHFGSHVKANELFSDEANCRNNLLHQPSLVSEDVRNERQCSEVEWQIPEKMPCLHHPKLHHMFTKHVKPKKQHEVSRMAEVIASLAHMENCQYIVDVGSGLGHLARLLAYGYGLKVCCLEAQENLSCQARKLDMELEASLSKILKDSRSTELLQPVHLSVMVDRHLTACNFTEALRKAFSISEETFSFGVVGLHSCGDLTPVLMRLFVQCPDARFINIVGCCYMKLTSGMICWLSNE